MIKTAIITVMGLGVLGASQMAPQIATSAAQTENAMSLELTLGALTVKTDKAGVETVAAQKPGFSATLKLNSGRVIKLRF